MGYSGARTVDQQRRQQALRTYCPNIYTVGHIERQVINFQMCMQSRKDATLPKKRVVGLCTHVGGKFMNTLSVLSLHQLKK